MGSKVVILGAGIGGLVTARELKARVKDRASITLIDRRQKFLFPPSFPWIITGTREPQHVERGLSLLKKRGIEVHHTEVTALDLAGRLVKTTSGSVPYDHLVIALGADLVPETIPGFSDHAHHMYDVESAVRLKRALDGFQGGKIAVGISRLPFKCPAAPYEMAMLLDDTFRRRGIREKVRMEFFTPEGAPLPAAGPENGAKVTALLQERDIPFHPKRKLKEITGDSLFFEEGEPLSYDLLVCIPPHRAAKPVAEAGLTDASGWVPVDPKTLQTQQPSVFAIGDVTTIPTPHGYVPVLPKAGVFAKGQAQVVANNLAVEILGKGERKSWDGFGACFLEVARGKSAFIQGNFLASPRPQLDFRSPSPIYHTQKVLYEKYWFRHWF